MLVSVKSFIYLSIVHSANTMCKLSGLAHVIFMNAYTNYQAGSNQYNWLLADLMKVSPLSWMLTQPLLRLG